MSAADIQLQNANVLLVLSREGGHGMTIYHCKHLSGVIPPFPMFSTSKMMANSGGKMDQFGRLGHAACVQVVLPDLRTGAGEILQGKGICMCLYIYMDLSIYPSIHLSIYIYL